MDTSYRAGFNRGSADKLSSRPYDKTIPFEHASSAHARERFRKGYRKGYERSSEVTGGGFGDDTPVSLSTSTTTTTKPTTSPFPMLSSSAMKTLGPLLSKTSPQSKSKSKFDGLRPSGGDRGGPLGGGGSDAPPPEEPPKTPPPAEGPPKTTSTDEPPTPPMTPPGKFPSGVGPRTSSYEVDNSEFGQYVQKLQRAMLITSFPGDFETFLPDGKYAGLTIEGVKALQRKFGLPVDGIPDKALVAKINEKIDTRNENVLKQSGLGGSAAIMVERLSDPPSPWPLPTASLVVRSATMTTTREPESTEKKEPLKQSEPSWFQKNWYWLAIGGVVLAGGGYAASRFLMKKEAPGGQAR